MHLKQPFGVRAAVWLAFESLPFFPMAPSHTTPEGAGFFYMNRANWFSWPIWSVPSSIETVKSLLTLPHIHEQTPDMRGLNPRGVEAVYRSKRELIGTKGYAILKPPERVG